MTDLNALSDSLVDDASVAAAGWLSREQLERLVGYWSRGHALIEGCLATANAGDHADAPIGLDADQARLWHAARVEAFRHALEMMGLPEGFGIPVPKPASPSTPPKGRGGTQLRIPQIDGKADVIVLLADPATDPH